MDSTKYKADYSSKGLVEIESIIESKYLQDAKMYRDKFIELTLDGNVTRSNRTPEQIEKDNEAVELLLELDRCENPALAWGFMLYNEASITKIYWTQRVGKLRKDKRAFFEIDKYLEWLTEIFSTLNGDHPKFHQPLYYYKLNGKSKDGRHVGDYDVMNSFRTHWNMYFLPILAIYLYAEDSKYDDYGISIDAMHDNENGAGNRLEAEIAKAANKIYDADQEATFLLIEDFLKAFNGEKLGGVVPLNTGAKGAGVTYHDILLAIVDGTWTTGKAAYQKFLIGPSIQAKVTQKIKYEMTKWGFTLEEFGKYLEKYRTIAIDILHGLDVSFVDEDA